MYPRKPRRLNAVILLFLCLFFVIVIKLFFIQATKSAYLKNLAQNQHSDSVELPPKRGTIYDRHLRPLSLSIPQKSLYAVPREISSEDKVKITGYLSTLLDLEEDFIRSRLNRDKSFVWIKRLLDVSMQEKINSKAIEGLGFIDESKRVYPNGNLASHVIGFAGMDNKGLEGIELFYDVYLKGQSGSQVVLKDARQRPIMERLNIYPRDGFDLVLTIDEVIQFIVEKHLEKAFKKYKAKAAQAIVMEPKTGRILALANFPTYDPNKNETNPDKRRNRVISDMFEPGSVFKVVLAAAALEEKKVKESDEFFCENGEYRVANHILHDHRPHAWLTFKDVIVQSSNIGVTKVAQKIGPKLIFKYIKLFGFGSLTGFDLPGEVRGTIKKPSGWSKTSIAAIPIGQEVGVTTLQLVCCISAIANKGVLMRPYILDRIQDKFGEVIKDFIPRVRRRVVSRDTANRLKDILVAVVDEGTGREASVSDMKVAGKTGTAQKVVNGRYSHSKFFATFMGFAPADKPEIAVVVVVDEPRPAYFGGVVSAPVFKNIVIEVLNYLDTQNPQAALTDD